MEFDVNFPMLEGHSVKTALISKETKTSKVIENLQNCARENTLQQALLQRTP